MLTLRLVTTNVCWGGCQCAHLGFPSFSLQIFALLWWHEEPFSWSHYYERNLFWMWAKIKQKCINKKYCWVWATLSLLHMFYLKHINAWNPVLKQNSRPRHSNCRCFGCLYHDLYVSVQSVVISILITWVIHVLAISGISYNRPSYIRPRSMS